MSIVKQATQIAHILSTIEERLCTTVVLSLLEKKYRRIYILSGNCSEAMTFKRANKIPNKSYCYISNKEKINGIGPYSYVFLVGTFWKRADYQEIIDAIQLGSRGTAIFINENPYSNRGI